MTNDVQRQLLADEIDDVSRSIQRYHKDIAELERKLSTKRIRLAVLQERKLKLEEGIDW